MKYSGRRRVTTVDFHQLGTMRASLLVCLLTLVSVHSAIIRVCVDYDAIYPASSYLHPGDTLQFYGTNEDPHWIVTILPDFSGQNTTGQINSGYPPAPGIFHYSVNLTDDITQQGVVWSDLLNGPTSAFGVAYVARSNDFFINWNVFQNHPPGPLYQLNTQYPLYSNIIKGQRVVWNSTAEDLLNHPVLFADLNFHATIGCPFSHPFVSNRNFHHFAWTFDIVGRFNFVCGVHYSMNGTIHVLPSDCSSADLADYSWVSSTSSSTSSSTHSPYGCF